MLPNVLPIFIALLLFRTAISPDKAKNEYYVIVVDNNVWSSHKGRFLKPIDIVGSNDLLNLGEGSFLSLVHSSGTVIEFTGPMVLKLESIRMQPGNFIGKDELSVLQLKSSGNQMASRDITQYLQLSYPFIAKTSKWNTNSVLCLEWIDGHESNNQYEILIFDSEDNLLKKDTIKQRFFSMDLRRIHNLTADSFVYFYIADLKNNNRKTDTYVVVFSSEVREIESCSQKLSGELLIIALMFEKKGLLKEADLFFKRAWTENRQSTGLKEVIDNFNSRHRTIE